MPQQLPLPNLQPFDGWNKQELISRIDELQDMNYNQYKENKRLCKELLEAQSIPTSKPTITITNQRGAGRKPILKEPLISNIRHSRTKGLSVREIAKEYNISLGTVCKAISIIHY